MTDRKDDCTMKPVHLIMVTDKNNNKFYDMIPNGDTFTIKYGRIDSTCTTLTKPMSEWDKIYRSKIKKGYVDKSDLVLEREDTGDYKAIADRVISRLIERLQDFANKTIQNNYTIAENQVTQKMVDEAADTLKMLAKEKDVSNFNRLLLRLFSIIPRKMKKVQDNLAASTSDFKSILVNENDLLDVLSAKVAANAKKASAVKNQQTILESLGLTIKNKDEALELQVKEMLGDLKDKFVNCWYVVNEKTQKRYDDRIKSQRGIHKTQELFWHGSRNENWMSILANGLMIRPSCAIHTGAMFGNAIYGANKARKSFGYTSATGSYWANGNSKTAFMAIFSFNTGKHHNVYHHTSECYHFNESYLKNKGNFDSVYAHKGVDLRNDEFMVYNENQVTIHALVELKS